MILALTITFSTSSHGTSFIKLPKWFELVFQLLQLLLLLHVVKIQILLRCEFQFLAVTSSLGCSTTYSFTGSSRKGEDDTTAMFSPVMQQTSFCLSFMRST